MGRTTMKKLLALAASFLVLGIFCCGLLGIFIEHDAASPSSGTSSPQADVPDSTASSPSSTSLGTEVDEIYDRENRAYEKALAAWEEASSESEAAKAEAEKLTKEIEEHNAAKPSVPSFEERTWTSVDGKYKTKATLIDTDNVTVELRRSDGREIELDKEKLIAEDRVYVHIANTKFNDYRAGLKEWESVSSDLNSQLESKQKVLDEASSPKPTPPNREKIAARLEAEAAERKAEEERAAMAAAAERAKQEQAARQGQLDQLSDLLSDDETANLLIDGFVLEGSGKLVVRVKNLWHIRAYQLRLQDAQNIAMAWKAIHKVPSGEVPRMSFVDMNGNEVGGADSLWGVWVQKE